MKFILTMARRELRSAWKRLLFFFLCIAMGVSAIVSLRSIIRNFNHVMTSDAKSILGADIQISSNRPWSKQTLSAIEKITGPYLQARAESIESSTMLRPENSKNETAILVEIKGIDPGFPFYGEFTLAQGKFSNNLLDNNGLLVAATILERLNLKVNDRVKIGDQVFQIRGVIVREPGTTGGFRFGPRVILSRSALEKAHLTGFGSRARRRIFLRIPEQQVDPVAKKLKSSLKGNFINVRSYKESQENMNTQFTRAENFLALTGFIILILGGIGVSSVTRVFIEEKRKSIAVLKCLGASGRKIFSIYFLQIASLGLAGSLLGVLLAKVILELLKTYYRTVLPPDMTYSLEWHAIIQGLGFGLLVTILFSALPLLKIRKIKPNVLLRDETNLTSVGHKSSRRKPDLLRWITAILVGAGLFLLSSWQSGSFQIGMFFFAGLILTALILQIAALLLMKLLRKMKRIVSFRLRHAISSIYRPGNQTQVILMAVGLGSFFIIAIQALQSNLLREMDFQRRTNLPNMYLIDIQTDQKEGVEKIITEATKQKALILPTVRARIAAINGKNVDPESTEYKKDRGRLGFEYTITYRDQLEETESILSGKFWNQTPSSNPEVSIEESLKGMMGLDVGGNMTFDILGRKITAKVTSIRRVDWKNSKTGFYIVFRPGVLESAPNVYVAALDAPTTEPARSRFQHRLVDAYPNVTAIDVADIIRSLQKILNTITLGISFIGSFVFLSGMLILIGSIAMTKFQRTYEAAILKTLGATRKLVISIFMIEYMLLGLVSGIIGTLAAMALSYLVSKYVFELDWGLTPVVYTLGLVLTVFLVTLVGSLSNLDVLNRKPLSVLRSQS